MMVAVHTHTIDLVTETAPLLVPWDRALRDDWSAPPNTRDSYTTDVRMVARWVAETYPAHGWSNLTPDHFRALREWMLAAGYKPTTWARRFSALRRWYDWLIVTRRVAASPLTEMKPEKRAGSTRAVLMPDQIAALFAATEGDTWMERRDRALLHVLFATGLSTSEVCGLQTSDVQADTLLVYARGSKLRGQRWLPLPEKAAAALATYLQTPRPPGCPGRDGWLFVGQQGHPMNRHMIWYIFSRMADRAGLSEPISTSIIRATVARNLLMAGVPYPEVAARLGLAPTFQLVRRYGGPVEALA